MKANLADPPKFFRSPVVSAGPDLADRIDRKGGNYSAGLIRGVSVITEGEALGHGLWIDAEFNAAVADAINAPNKGAKSRFTHPGLSSDGLGRHLGRVTNARVEGSRVLADLHLAESAHDTPDGDLAAYVMNLAAEDPEAFGISIAFAHDFAAQDDAEVDNPLGLPHVRLADLQAVDVVDTPAANPGGLFHSRGADVAYDADAAIAYALGRSDDKPGAFLGVDADRVRGAVSRYLSTFNLQVCAMADEVATPAVTPETPETPAVEPATPETPAVEPETPAAELSAEDPRAEAKRFVEAFGAKGGEYFAEGLTFAEARDRQVAALQAENEDLRTRLAAASAASGEVEPVAFSPAEKTPKNGFAGKIRLAGAN